MERMERRQQEGEGFAVGKTSEAALTYPARQPLFHNSALELGQYQPQTCLNSGELCGTARRSVILHKPKIFKPIL